MTWRITRRCLPEFSQPPASPITSGGSALNLATFGGWCPCCATDASTIYSIARKKFIRRSEDHEGVVSRIHWQLSPSPEYMDGSMLLPAEGAPTMGWMQARFI